MKEEMKEKRDRLKKLSAEAGELVQQKGEELDTVNAALLELYKTEGHTEIHSFNGWLQKGFAVKRGEKALLLWGSPRQGTKQEKAEGDTDGDEFKFYPVAYVFSQKQVQPMRQLAR